MQTAQKKKTKSMPRRRPGAPASTPMVHSHKVEDYLVITYINNRPHKIVWNASEKPLPLDFPNRWVLEKREEGVLVTDLSAPEDCDPGERSLLVAPELIETSEAIEVPPPWGNEGKPFYFRMYPLRPIRPAYAPPQQKNVDRVPHQVFLFHGTKKYLINYRPATNSYRGVVENIAVFGYRRTREGYEFTAYKPGVHLRTSKEDARVLSAGDPVLISEDELARARISFKKHWWRLNRIPLSPPLPPEIFEDDGRREQVWFNKMVRRVIVGFIACSILVFLLPKPKESFEPLPQTVALQKPKLIPQIEPKIAKVEPPKPKPPEPKAPEPKPVKTPDPPKPVPQAQKPSVKPSKKPPKAPKLPPPPPPPPAAAPREVKNTVQPPQNAPVAPPKGPPPEVVAAQQAAAQKAQQKAQLAQSLSFLSGNSKVTAKTTDYAQINNKLSNVGGTATGKVDKNNYLNKVAGGPGIQGGPIDTKGSREIQTGKIVGDGVPGGVIGGTGKAGSKVYGKVSLDNLNNYDPGGDAGGSLGGGGISMSGAGNINEKAVMDALNKRLAKLQYCYEKALLSDSSLSGNVMMEWTINPDGSASKVHVVKSQMNNKDLHSCIAKEIAKVKFPSPVGGSVLIKYPFNFSASAL